MHKPVSHGAISVAFPKFAAACSLDQRNFGRVKKAIAHHKVRPDTVRTMYYLGTDDNEYDDFANFEDPRDSKNRPLKLLVIEGESNEERGGYKIALWHNHFSWSSSIIWDREDPKDHPEFR